MVKSFLGNYSLLWIALILYSVSLLFALWRLASARPYRRWPKLILTIPGFFSHTYFLWERGLSTGRCPVSNLFETLTFIAWCLVGLHLLIISLRRFHYLTVFYMPIVLVIQLAALIIPPDRVTFADWKEGSWLGLHASVIVLGYAAFGLAAAVAVMYLLQEKQLRSRRLSTSFMLLPPVLRLEGLQAQLICAGFALLTVGLLVGFLGVYSLGKTLVQSDSKLLWSVAIWGMYIALLLGRYRLRMSGRWMAWLSVLSFVFVVSTFWLANAFSKFHQY
jgi:HemX protein